MRGSDAFWAGGYLLGAAGIASALVWNEQSGRPQAFRSAPLKAETSDEEGVSRAMAMFGADRRTTKIETFLTGEVRVAAAERSAAGSVAPDGDADELGVASAATRADPSAARKAPGQDATEEELVAAIVAAGEAEAATASMTATTDPTDPFFAGNAGALSALAGADDATDEAAAASDQGVEGTEERPVLTGTIGANVAHRGGAAPLSLLLSEEALVDDGPIAVARDATDVVSEPELITPSVISDLAGLTELPPKRPTRDLNDLARETARLGASASLLAASVLRDGVSARAAHNAGGRSTAPSWRDASALPQVASLRVDEESALKKNPAATPHRRSISQTVTARNAKGAVVRDLATTAGVLSTAQAIDRDGDASDPSGLRLGAPALSPELRAGATLSGVSVETVQYSSEGAVVIRGRGAPGEKARLYLDSALEAEAAVAADGAWEVNLADSVAPAVYVLRVDQVSASGVITAQAELPFERASSDAVQLGEDGVVVQPGNSLWQIAEHIYGDGNRYVEIYGANRRLIRNPNLIYPGQILNLPRQLAAVGAE